MDNSDDSDSDARIQAILSGYNYPKSVSYENFFDDDTENGKSSNSSKLDDFINCIQNAEKFNYKNSVYDTRGVSKGRALLLYSSSRHDGFKKTIKELFEEKFNFEFEPLVVGSKSIFDDLSSYIINAENCCALFILAECKNKELIFKNDLKLQIATVIADLKKAKLEGKPKLIFIQNLGNGSLELPEEPLNDFSILISPAQNNSFVKDVCHTMNKNCVEYDLLAILKKFTIKTINCIWPKPTLTKTLFFKRHLTKDEWKIIKNDDLFYQKGHGRCLIMRYGDDYKNESLQLETKFKDLNFETCSQDIDNNYLKRIFGYDMLQNHFAYDGFFVVMFVNDKTNSTYIMNLIEHLTDVESLIGKPKVLFLLGPLHYTIEEWTKSIVNNKNTKKFTEEQYDEFINNNTVILAKHADIMVFQSELVTETVNSICDTFNDVNVNQHDLMRLLLKVSSSLDKSITAAGKNPICINSTLTRLVSLRTTDLKISDYALKAKFQLSNSIVDVLTEVKRGKCYIFNYQTYDNDKEKLLERTCAPSDQEALSYTFGEKLGFQVIPNLYNLNKSKTSEMVDKISCEDHACLVVFFLTHGNDNKIMCSDKKKTRRNKIIEKIANNRHWIGKPKFIFFATCRGELEEKHAGPLQGDVLSRSDSPLAKYPDMFIFFPTFEGHVSWSNITGSVSINILCNRLEKDHNQYDIFTILARAAREICQHNGYHEIKEKPGLRILTKEAPTFYSTLKNAYSFGLN